MTLLNVTFDKAYTSSKAEEYQSITGDFEVTDVIRNDRRKIISTADGAIYWVDNTLISDEVVATSDSEITQNPEEVTDNTNFKTENIPQMYVAKRGDTLNSIAYEFGIDEYKLRLLNNITSVVIGQRIRLR